MRRLQGSGLRISFFIFFARLFLLFDLEILLHRGPEPPKLKTQNVPKMTALFRQRTKSMIIRKGHELDAPITSAELYALFSTIVKQASRQPLVDSVEVRMMVVYSRWVQIVTAKTTRFYITSIVEGWDNIANQMEIYQTPWFNFMTILGQQCILLAVFESTRMQTPDTKGRTPLRDMAPREQNLKHKLPTAEMCGSKKKKIKHKPDGTKDTLPIF
ncbi:hypothetical protein VC83_06882 [Pseudogymnoascus destructans]|uniref:Uncharacterized protein n=1 Tax=Pseudogymnoascus destructans TaxID=655981 RepID=A0A177A262_9PEZI|nr:uncharacterized protein VC83_06882 [Pseudogymnoascus destructans]OAF56355.1 hypothetical protein VC83_06882 [Pseudogymnoascus destructans]